MNYSQVVTLENFDEVLSFLDSHDELAFDTETTGLSPFLGDELFSIIFSNGAEGWYFNFQDYNTEELWQHKPEHVLPRAVIPKLQPLFSSFHRLFIHNAKFDSHIIEKEGIRIDADVWCTQTMARVLYNDHLKYSLAACAERIGEKKDDAVEEYITKYKLWEWVEIPGKKKREKNKFYDRVPFAIMQPYGLQDAHVGFRLGQAQKEELKQTALTEAKGRPSLSEVVEFEKDITKVCTRIEHTGLAIDRRYINEGIDHESLALNKAIDTFQDVTGMEWKDSNKVLAQAFANLGFNYPTTKKGNPSFTDEVLENFKNPVAEAVRTIRFHDKRLNTYFRSYLYWADPYDVIHADLRQASTVTGRFSCANPNLQNVPKEDTSDFKIRSSFVPRSGFYFSAIDYRQMEFRLMLDYAGQMDLIGAILDGHDPHQTTADLVGIDRRAAKTLNFGLLYGMGVGKLADQLGVDKETASEFKAKYFAGLPKVKKFLRNSGKIAEKRGFVFDWSGRRFYYPKKELSYKAANSIIQGGCSSVVKKAMVAVQRFIEREQLKSRINMQIHDELLYEIHFSETGVEEKFAEIMGGVYKAKHIPLTCSIDYSFKSWGDMSEGTPSPSDFEHEERKGPA